MTHARPFFATERTQGTLALLTVRPELETPFLGISMVPRV